LGASTDTGAGPCELRTRSTGAQLRNTTLQRYMQVVDMEHLNDYDIIISVKAGGQRQHARC
jgi:hypothetical protein